MTTTHVPSHCLHSWYFKNEELLQSPSHLDGIDRKLEKYYREDGARLILKVGSLMGLCHDTIATGIVFLHRFYMFHSFRSFPRHVTACCCLFLAGKVEETPKKCDDIIAVAKSLLNEVHFKHFGENPKRKITTLERILLQTIRFDFHVDHPYVYLMKYIKCIKEDKRTLEKVVQMAWTFANDSFCTTLCLQWEPEIIAVALMYLATKLSKIKVTDWINRKPNQKHWWDLYVSGLTVPMLEDICHQILDLYAPVNSK